MKSTRRVAVVGAGITGSCVAAELAKRFDHIVVFDQGRRGPGGRASHRTVNPADNKVVVDPSTVEGVACYEFDHGAQFFRADSPNMRAVAETWCERGWAVQWEARFGSVGAGADDFFGVPARRDPVYVGVGGMHTLPAKILKSVEGDGVVTRCGTRVSGIRKTTDGQWELLGTQGTAAYHDTAEKVAAAAVPEVLATVDAVVLTDISSSSGGWHRASAGVPEDLRGALPKRVRVPFFVCMVALESPIGDRIPYDAFTCGTAATGNADGTNALWFAARSQSKPGQRGGGARECWTLVSTPAFAVDEITETKMQDPVTGAFRPQEDGYLNKVPGPALFDAFVRAVTPLLAEGTPAPKAAYLQAHRWGSGLPVPPPMAATTREVCDVLYGPTLASSVVYDRPPTDAADFVADDANRLYYAGDYVSQRNPGFEAAALSGIDVARHMISHL